MKTDRYTKIILTIIATCLLWICVRDIGLAPAKLFASPAAHAEIIDVNIVGAEAYALTYAGPIHVRVDN